MLKQDRIAPSCRIKESGIEVSISKQIIVRIPSLSQESAIPHVTSKFPSITRSVVDFKIKSLPLSVPCLLDCVNSVPGQFSEGGSIIFSCVDHIVMGFANCYLLCAQL